MSTSFSGSLPLLSTKYLYCTIPVLSLWQIKYVCMYVCGFDVYRKDSTCESSGVFTSDVFWFLS